MSRLKNILLLLGLLTLAGRLAAELAVGDPMPGFADRQLEGTLPETAGRVVLVDFWASWCAPCQASFPALAKLHQEFSSRGVTIVGVSVDKKAGDYDKFLKKHAPPFPTLRDAAQRYVAAVQVPTMPTSYVVGRDGRIRAILVGFHGEETDRAIRAALAAALAEKAVP